MWGERCGERRDEYVQPLSQVYKVRPQVFTIVKLDTRGNYKTGRSSSVRPAGGRG